MKKFALVTIVILMTASIGFSQSETDALRYSQLMYGGTARFAAMGGSFGALGGDFSSLSINPAGIAVYRGSEITITPALNFSRIETTYFNTPEEDTKYDFNLGNFGAVITFPTSGSDDNGGWQFVNIGFGINRHNNFNERWIARGFNDQNSFFTSIFNVDFDMPNTLQQQLLTTSSGSIREFVLSLGANYDDRLYLGATLGLPSVKYEQSLRYFENDLEGLNENFNSTTYNDWFKTSGSGYTFKLGAIYRISDYLRLGGAFHTPTFFKFEDKYEDSLQSDINTDNNNYNFSRKGLFRYKLDTPIKALGSVGFVFGNMGLINVEYEYIDYSTARLRERSLSNHQDFPDDITKANEVIRNSFGQQHSIRVGGELRLNPLLLRAGYVYNSSPYKSGVNDGQRTLISTGFGIRESNYSIDFAYTYAFFSDDYSMYQVEGMNPLVHRDFTASTFRATLGWRF